MVINHDARKNVWILTFLNKLLPKQAVKRIKVLEDNKKSLILTKNSKSQNRTKYVDVMYHNI